MAVLTDEEYRQKYITGPIEQARVNYANAVGVDPDEEARVQEMAKTMGVSVGIARSNYEGIKKLKAFDQIKQSPALTRFFSSPDNARLGHDNVDGLKKVSDAIDETEKDKERRKRLENMTFADTIVNLGRSFAGGAFSGFGALATRGYAEEIARSQFGQQIEMRSFDNDEAEGPIDPEALAILRTPATKLKEISDEYIDAPEEVRGEWQNQIASGLGQFAGQMTAAALGSVFGMSGWSLLFAQGAGSMGEQIEEHTKRLVEEGRAPEGGTAGEHAAFVLGTLTTFLTEKFGLEFIANKSAGRIVKALQKSQRATRLAENRVSRLLLEGGINALGEGTQEVSEDLGQALAMKLFYDSSVQMPTMDDLVQTFWVSAAVGGIAGYGVNLRALARTRQDKRNVDTIVNAVREGDKIPEAAMSNLLGSAKTDGTDTIYMEEKPLKTYFQKKGMDYEEGLKRYNIKKGEQGGYLQMPIESLPQLVKSDVFTQMRDHMKMDPNALTPSEERIVRATQAQSEKEIKELLQNLPQEALDKYEQERQRAIRAIQNDLLGPLSERYNDSTANTQTVPLATWFGTLFYRNALSRAAEEGRILTPRDISRQILGAWWTNRLTVNPNVLESVLTTPRNSDPIEDALLESLRNKERPTDSQLYGKTLGEKIREMGGLDLNNPLLNGHKANEFPANLARRGKGLAIDEIAMMNEFRGYDIQGTDAEDSVSKIMRALAEEMREGGTPLYDSSNFNEALWTRMKNQEWLEEMLDEAGINLDEVKDNAEVRRRLDEYRQKKYQEMLSNRYDQRGFTAEINPTEEEREKANKQYDNIVKQYRGTDQWLKAPNGQPTKLTERQWVQVRTENFKNWFGDWENNPESASKVVDENGEPLVVFHTTTEDFDAFDLSQARQNMDIPAFYFSSGTGDWAAMGNRTIPAFLKILNPVEKPNANGEGAKVRRRLVAEGHDGTIASEEGMETEYAAFYPDQIKSANENIGTYSESNNIFHQIIGEKGAKRLDELDQLRGQMREAGSRMDNLNIAKEMKEAGKDANTVWRATGWHEGVDGKWRYEIKYGELKTATVASQGNATLGELLNAPDLFSAYPKMAETKIKPTTMEGVNGYYSERENTIYLASDFFTRKNVNQERYNELVNTDEYKAFQEQWSNAKTEEEREKLTNAFNETAIGKELLDMASNPRTEVSLNEKGRQTLIHEVQHAVQREEGFARGGNVDEFIRADRRLAESIYDDLEPLYRLYNSTVLSKWLDIQQKWEKASKKQDKALMKQYEDEEQELRETQEWRNWHEEAELQIARIKEKYAGVPQMDWVLDNAYSIDSPRFKDFIQDLVKLTPEERYRRLAGEVEARIAALRAGLTEQERLNMPIPLSELFDVDRKDQIVLRQGEMARAALVMAQDRTRIYNQTAWHGSPYRFERFSTDNMGRGEGAQSHGWGLYFAGRKEVADYYRAQTLRTGYEFFLNGERLPTHIQRKLKGYLNGLNKAAHGNRQDMINSFYGWMARLDRDGYDVLYEQFEKQIKKIDEDPNRTVDDFLADVEKEEDRFKSYFKEVYEMAGYRAQDHKRAMNIQDIRHYLDYDVKDYHRRTDYKKDFAIFEAIEPHLDHFEVRQDKTGQLYEVTIPESEGMLDEQKRLSDQPAIMKKVRREARKRGLPLRGLREANGRDLYRYLEDKLGSPMEASLFLNAAGIDGITYVGQQDGRCFVIFDDRAVSIENTYYQTGWHGSPFNFDRFSENNVGTGIGVAAHGWGFYFAKDRETGEMYRTAYSHNPYRGMQFFNNGQAVLGDARDILRHIIPSRIFQAALEGKPFKAELRDKLDEEIERAKKRVKTLENDYNNGLALRAELQRINENPNRTREDFIKAVPKDVGIHILWDAVNDNTVLGNVYEVTKGMPIDRIKKAIEEALKWYDWEATSLKRARERLKTLESFDPENFAVKKSKEGQLYEVDIPNKESLLIEEIPLRDQPEIMKKLKEKGIAFSEEETGKELYDRLAAEKKGKKAASLFLNDAGIEGITYVQSGEGQCFVIFNEKAINILNTYYQGETNLPGGLNPDDPETQGAFYAGGPGNYNIYLFRTADFSTFAHESSHFMLEIIRNLATSSDASPYIREEYERICKYLGVGEDGVILPEQHEKFARSFEAYLMEGKAPSEELRTVFRRFKQWLTNIYHELRNLGVPLSKDIREVFDRMLATDREIEIAKGTSKDLNIITTPEQLGGNKTLFDTCVRLGRDALEAAREHLLTDAMKYELRKRTKTYKEELKHIKKELKEQWDNIPAVKARRDLCDPKSGIHFDYDQLVMFLGSESYVKKLSRVGRHPMYTKKGNGMDMDLIAKRYGFESGEALIKAINELPNEKAWIEAESDRLMKERYKDILVSDDLADLAQEALHNKDRHRLQAMELQILRYFKRIAEAAIKDNKQEENRLKKELKEKAIGIWQAEAQQLQERFTERAKQTVGDTLVRKIRTDLYLNTWHKWMREVAAAMGKQDYDAALEAKRNELNFSLIYSEGMDAKKKIEQKQRLFKRILNGEEKKVAANRTMPEVFRARYILAAHGLTEQSPDYWMERMRTAANNGEQVDLTEEPRVYWRDMTYNEFMSMAEEVGGLWENAYMNKRVEIDGKRIEVATAAEEVSSELKAFSGDEPNKTRSDSLTSNVISDMTRVEQTFTMIGGVHGALMKYIFQPIKDACDRARLKEKEVNKRLENAITKLNFYQGKIEAPELAGPDGKPHIFGQNDISGGAELFGMILHMGNPSNLRKLILGYGWGTMDANGKLNLTRFNAFLNRMVQEGKLTKEHFDAAQEVWDTYNDLKPEAQKANRAIYGTQFKEVQYEGFESPFGWYRGGYVPAKTDSLQVNNAIKQELAYLSDIDNKAFNMMAMQQPGFTKERNESYAEPLDLNPRTIVAATARIINYAYIAPAFHDVRKVLSNKQVIGAFNHYKQDFIKDAVVPWLQRSRLQTATYDLEQASGRRWAKIRARAGAMLMFGKLINSIQQGADLLVGASEVRVSNLMAAITDHDKDAIMDKSLFMRDRMGESQRAMLDNINAVLIDATPLQKADRWFLTHAYFAQQLVDDRASIILWTAAYNDALQDGHAELEAIRHADSIVRKIMMSQNPEDVSNVEAGSSFKRVFTQFSGFFMTRTNVIFSELGKIAHEAGAQGNDSAGTKAMKILANQKMKAAILLLTKLIVPAFVDTAIALALKGSLPGDDDWMHDMFVGSAGYVSGLGGPYANLAGDVVINFGDMAAGGRPNTYNTRVVSSAAFSIIEEMVKTAYSMAKSGITPEKILTFGGDITLILPVPVAPKQAVNMVKYVAGVANDDIEPTDPVDFFRGAVTGYPSEESKKRKRR